MLSLIRDGVTYSLDDGTLCYYYGDDGLGMPAMHRFGSRGPLQHGETDRGYRLDPRIVRLLLGIPAASQAELYTGREQLLELLAPGDEPIALRWKLPGDVIRQIDVHYVDDVSYDSQSRVGWEQKLVARLKAPDPTFYDPQPVTQNLAAAGGGDTMLVPTVIPSTLGSSNFDATGVVDYAGNWRGLPYRIRATGPITHLKIVNTLTGEKLELGLSDTIAAGDYYDFDLRYGYKTLVDKNGVSRIDKLTTDSDLETWHLVAREPLAGYRSNPIEVTGTSISSASRVDISFYARYLGV